MSATTTNTFEFTRKSLATGSGPVGYFSLAALDRELGGLGRLPFTVKILLESLLRHQGHPAYRPEHVQQLARWGASGAVPGEVPFMPGRVLLQDFTGVPCVVDLATLRSALQRLGKDPRAVEPLIPVDLVIDHSVQLDRAGCPAALETNETEEFARNAERYRFLKWGQQAFRKLRVLPPGLGICHQINMEYLATCVTRAEPGGVALAFPDTLVGTDSHTVMVNSLGVLGWGVGGIEAEAAMLGEPISILAPTVVGVRLLGRLPPGATATDAALGITQALRRHGVVEKFVEFFGPGVKTLALAERGPLANMAPEYGATTGFFPVDEATLDYLRATGRTPEQVDLVERYCKEQGLWYSGQGEPPRYSETLDFDLAAVEPCLAGPRRPHERLALAAVGTDFNAALGRPADQKGFGVAPGASAPAAADGLDHGAVVIASITSCTNTATPALMLGAGIMARKARARGLKPRAHVKTSLAPGSRAVTEYLRRAGLLEDLAAIGFTVDAYGCATCIGNSGPLAPEIAREIKDRNLVVAAVLSGNRNFEGRIHPQARANYLASPLLVVAYALRGSVRTDLARDPLGMDSAGQPVYLRDIWPTPEEVQSLLAMADNAETYRALYADTANANPRWNELDVASGPLFAWQEKSTYIRELPVLAGIAGRPAPLADIRQARVFGFFGDFITTDHISPAGSIPMDGQAGCYLLAKGVQKKDFNSFGARRGNHEVMLRGTFANIRIRNKLADREGGWTRYHPDGAQVTFYEAATKYAQAGTPLVVLAGKMYGAGSSRDWAAKGTALLGVRAVIAESFERIHRSNLVEMGVLPLEFLSGQSAESLGLTGLEHYSIAGVAVDFAPGKILDVTAVRPDASTCSFQAKARIDTPVEVDYYRHGGILPFVLRKLAAG